jgi:hypothetical protein
METTQENQQEAKIEPKSSDKKIQKISNMLIKESENKGVEFCFGEQPLSSIETFSYYGALSLFLVEAKEIFEKTYNNLWTVKDLMEPLGGINRELTIEEEMLESEYLKKLPKNKTFPITFVADSGINYFGFVPYSNSDFTVKDFYMVTHFTHYVIENYIKTYALNRMLLVDGRIPLDPLFEKLNNKLNSYELNIARTKPSLSSKN